jgi:hypothetical protein
MAKAVTMILKDLLITVSIVALGLLSLLATSIEILAAISQLEVPMPIMAVNITYLTRGFGDSDAASI